MENRMKRKTKCKFRRKTKYMNIIDTTAYKGKRFEIKQNLDFKWDLSKQIIYFSIFGPDSCSESFSFQRIHLTWGEKIRHLRNTKDSWEFEKKVSEFKSVSLVKSCRMWKNVQKQGFQIHENWWLMERYMLGGIKNCTRFWIPMIYL